MALCSSAITERAPRQRWGPRSGSRGGEVDASDYAFRAATQIETAYRDLDWLNNKCFISVGARRPGGLIYDTYLVA